MTPSALHRAGVERRAERLAHTALGGESLQQGRVARLQQQHLADGHALKLLLPPVEGAQQRGRQRLPRGPLQEVGDALDGVATLQGVQEMGTREHIVAGRSRVRRDDGLERETIQQRNLGRCIEGHGRSCARLVHERADAQGGRSRAGRPRSVVTPQQCRSQGSQEQGSTGAGERRSREARERRSRENEHAEPG